MPERESQGCQPFSSRALFVPFKKADLVGSLENLVHLKLHSKMKVMVVESPIHLAAHLISNFFYDNRLLVFIPFFESFAPRIQGCLVSRVHSATMTDWISL